MTGLSNLWHFIKTVFHIFQHEKCSQSASALTFTTLFALVPCSILIFEIIKLFPALSNKEDLLHNFIFEHFIPTTGNDVLNYLQVFSAQSSQLTHIGIAVILVTAILLFKSIEETINHIWGVPNQRHSLKSVLSYWLIISIGPLLLTLGLLVSSWMMSLDLLIAVLGKYEQTYWAEWLIFFADSMFGTLTVLSPWLLSAIGFSLLYLYAPNCHIPKKSALYGGLIAANLFETAKWGFSWFISNLSNYQIIYGAFAIVPVFLLWVYLGWYITLLGVVCTKAIVEWRANRYDAAESELYQTLRILKFLWQSQESGIKVTAEEMSKLLAELRCRKWSEIRQFLLDQKLISISNKGEFRCIKDFNHIPVSKLIIELPWHLKAWHQQVHHYENHNQTSTHEEEIQAWQHILSKPWQHIEESIQQEFNLSLQSLLAQINNDLPKSDQKLASSTAETKVKQ